MRMDRRSIWIVALALTAILTVSCRNQREHAYIKDAQRNTPMDIANNYAMEIMPDDLLYISVYSETPESAYPFNEETNKGGGTSTKVQGYRVSQSGSIMFPLLGAIEAAGKSLNDLATELERRLRNEQYVSDAIVTVSLMNFHVSVIGEVKRPRVLHCQNGRLTIFEALAQCGDITEDGLRDKVVVVRNGIDDQIVDTLDLTNRQVLNSPYYYLQQNDIVFVEPTPKKRRRAYRNEDWPRYLNIGVNLLEMAYRTIYSIQLMEPPVNGNN